MTEVELSERLRSIIRLELDIMSELVEFLPQYKEMYQLLNKQTTELAILVNGLKNRQGNE